MKITVVGLGVIGGSFVKALKGKGYEVYGIDTNQQTLDMAKEEGCIIEGYLDGKDIIPKTDLTIICLYPSLVLDFIKNNQFKPGSIVTDAVGIKSYFLREALSIIPEDVEYISIHPMAGREKKGYQYASKQVFENANFIIVYHDDNKKSTIDFVQEFSKQLGFRSVKIMSPEAHDEIKYETGKYIGDSFRDLTRIANINEDLWDELFMNNKQYLLASIERFEEQLDILKNAIRDNDDESLKAAFRKSTKRREHL